LENAAIPPTYDYRKVLTAGQTNAMATLGFAEHFRVQATVRALWVSDCVSGGGQCLAEGLDISTKVAHCEFRKPYFALETLLCRMHIEDLQRVSARLIFEYYDEGGNNLHAIGWQQVVFKDAARKTCRMPLEFAIAARAILWETRPRDIANAN